MLKYKKRIVIIIISFITLYLLLTLYKEQNHSQELSIDVENEIKHEELHKDFNFITNKGIEQYLTLDNIEVSDNLGIYLNSFTGNEFTQIIEDESGNYIIVGSVYQEEYKFNEKIQGSTKNSIIIKIDKKTNDIDYDTFVLENDGFNIFYDVKQDNENNYIVIGNSTYVDEDDNKVKYAGVILKYDENLNLLNYQTQKSAEHVMFSKLYVDDNVYGIGTVFLDDLVFYNNTGKAYTTIIEYDKNLENFTIGDKMQLLNREPYSFNIFGNNDYPKYQKWYSGSSLYYNSLPDAFIKGIEKVDSKYILLCNIVEEEFINNSFFYNVDYSITKGILVRYDNDLNINKIFEYEKEREEDYLGLAFSGITINNNGELIIVGNIAYTYGEYFSNGETIAKDGGINKNYKFRAKESFLLKLNSNLELIEEKFFNTPYIHFSDELIFEKYYIDNDGRHIKNVDNVDKLDTGDLYNNFENIDGIVAIGDNYVIYGRTGYLESYFADIFENAKDKYSDFSQSHNTFITILDSEFVPIKKLRILQEEDFGCYDLIVNDENLIVTLGKILLIPNLNERNNDNVLRGKMLVTEFDFDVN